MTPAEFKPALAEAIRRSGTILKPFSGEDQKALFGSVESVVFGHDFDMLPGSVVRSDDGSYCMILDATPCGSFVLAHVVRLSPDALQADVNP